MLELDSGCTGQEPPHDSLWCECACLHSITKLECSSISRKKNTFFFLLSTSIPSVKNWMRVFSSYQTGNRDNILSSDTHTGLKFRFSMQPKCSHYVREQDGATSPLSGLRIRNCKSKIQMNLNSILFIVFWINSECEITDFPDPTEYYLTMVNYLK